MHEPQGHRQSPLSLGDPQRGQTYFFSSILSSTTCLAWSPFACAWSLPYLAGHSEVTVRVLHSALPLLPPHLPPGTRMSISSSTHPKTFVLMGLGEAHQTSTAWQKMLELSWPKGLGHQPPPTAFWGTGQPHLLSSRSSTCLVVAKARYVHRKMVT